MFRDYVRTAIRKLVKDKVFSLINIAGLSIALASSFIILLCAAHSLTYDRFNTNLENIYRRAGEVKTDTIRMS